MTPNAGRQARLEAVACTPMFKYATDAAVRFSLPSTIHFLCDIFLRIQTTRHLKKGDIS